MFDGVDSGPNGALRAFGAMSVCRGFKPQSMRFIDQRVEFGLRQLRRVHGIGKREYATCRASLDDGRTVFVCEANRPACFIGSVDHANFRPGLWTQRSITVSGLVTMPARRPDGVYRHQHTWPRNDTALDRISQTRIQII